MDSQQKDKIYTHLRNRGYKHATVKSYASNLFNLFSFFPNTPPEEISQEQVLKYLKSLKAQGKSASTIKNIRYACDFYFNDILDKKHKYIFKLPVAPPPDYSFFAQDQVFRMIDGCPNIKHKCILMCIYSLGLTTGELRELKVKDVRGKDGLQEVHVLKNKSIRKLFLSPHLRQELKKYAKMHALQAEDYLFHNPESKKQYSTSSIKKIVEAAVERAGLNPQLKAKELRYSYFKHMTDLGAPLSGILISMGLDSPDSVHRYHRLIYGDANIRYSPLDRIITDNNRTESFDALENLIRHLHDQEVATYLKEAIDCLRTGALRAGVIFVWNAAISRIHKQLAEPVKFPAINTHLKAMNSRTKVTGIDDFQKLKDETVLILSEKLGLFDKAEKDTLSKSCLDLRNKCGHPSKYQPEIHKVKAFVEDVVHIVFK